MVRRSHVLLACSIVVTLSFVGYGFAEINLEDMAGLWLFEEGAGKVVEDISGNKNDGEFDKGPKWAKGQFGGGLEFDGTANFVVVPHNDMFNFEDDDFTIGCWMDAQNKVLHLRRKILKPSLKRAGIKHFPFPLQAN